MVVVGVALDRWGEICDKVARRGEGCFRIVDAFPRFGDNGTEFLCN